MKFKVLFYIFEIITGLSSTIWFLSGIIMTNTITYNQVYIIDENCHVDLQNLNIYMYNNNIKNEKLMSSAKINNMKLIIGLSTSIIFTTIFIIIYACYIIKKRKQRKQTTYSLLSI